MTANTPTPASDLDARVAAILELVDDYEDQPTSYLRRVIEQALRAELQKPALQANAAVEPYAYEWLTPNTNGTWCANFGFQRPKHGVGYKNVKPLYEHPPVPAAVEPIAWINPGDLPNLKGNYNYRVTLNCEKSEYHGFTVPLGVIDSPVPARAQEEITDAARLDWIEARTHDSSHSIQVRLVRDPAVNAGINRIELRTACGSGMYERATEGHDLRAAIDAAIRASKGEKT